MDKQTASEKPVTAALKSCKFFENLDDEKIQLIRPSAKRLYQPKNTVIFHEGEPCKGFFIVESGAVKLYKESSDAREHVLHVVLPGDVFGEAALFLGTGYPATAAAVQDSTIILVRKDDFLNLLSEHPEISFRMMAAMATWLHRLVSSIESLTLKDASARFAHYILSLVPDNARDGIVVSLGMPKQILASHLGMTGETLSRLLARFEADNLIIAQGRKLQLISLQDIKDIAEHGAA